MGASVRGGAAPRRRLPAGKEQDTVRAILQFLAAHRIPAFRMNTGATKIGGRFLRFGAVGMSDILAIWTRAAHAILPHDGHGVNHPAGCGGKCNGPPIGQWLAIEVKSATGTVTPAQQAFIDQVNAAGGKAFVAKSVDDVQRALGL